ncbi:hypothetical protein Y1Q_0005952 [Alligator mississippiensis]|uniref:Ig-like domain-containing protein n=1 Tax=Alligator mississippiensis TaxID=8496 RepID=A0A151MYZ1_ALLMI|nr:hypothetical protein Y1Q_0005952 [Alligator mississippiensis]
MGDLLCCSLQWLTSPTAPTLFPLVTSCGKEANQDPKTLGCLALDFFPDKATFSWNNKQNSSISEGIRNFPAVWTNAGTFTAATQISISAINLAVQRPLYCVAKHPQGQKALRIPPVIPRPVLMTLHSPILEDFEGPYRNASIMCQVKNLLSQEVDIQWMKNGVLLKSGITTMSSTYDDEWYLLTSELSVTEGEWNANNNYTCLVDSPEFSEMKNISKSITCGSDCINPNIEVDVIPPTFAETYLTKSAKLTCQVINMPSAEGLNVVWLRENGQALETTLQPPVLESNGRYSVVATASVCVDEWNEGKNYTCKVTHTGLEMPIEKTLCKSPVTNSHAPSIYVFSPPPEQLALHEAATVTCLAKGFNPPEFFIQWLQNGELMKASSYITGSPTLESQKPELYFAYSTLTISEQEWNAGNTYSCLVGHEKLPLQVAQKTIDKSTGKPTLVNVSLVLSDTANTCY